ncbi:uncharacterized protein LOC113881857 [Bos indicus x Bos taurus]|uniref:uncharacterized protein LOC113881857 n=1 Tax=Bos indicus x Bos taurus TaxID=30522 RepID=UPI000572B5D6|nr:uncharacterized protein LOC113881857 [Bos indicus x Bos taurus]
MESSGCWQTRVRSHSPDASGPFPALLPATQGHPRDRCEGPQSRCRRPATRNLRTVKETLLLPVEGFPVARLQLWPWGWGCTAACLPAAWEVSASAGRMCGVQLTSPRRKE